MTTFSFSSKLSCTNFRKLSSKRRHITTKWLLHFQRGCKCVDVSTLDSSIHLGQRGGCSLPSPGKPIFSSSISLSLSLSLSLSCYFSYWVCMTLRSSGVSFSPWKRQSTRRRIRGNGVGEASELFAPIPHVHPKKDSKLAIQRFALRGAKTGKWDGEREREIDFPSNPSSVLFAYLQDSSNVLVCL